MAVRVFARGLAGRPGGWAKSLILLVMVFITGCGTNAPDGARLDVAPSKKLLTQIGGTVSLQAAFTGVAASPVAWQSGDPAIATVDAQGVVTAVAEGRTTVTARAGDLSGSAAIIVNTHVTALNAQIRYEDKELGPSGFTGVRSFKNVRFAQVELIDSSGDVLQTVSTGADGVAAFDPWPTSDAYTVRVYADTDPARGPDIGVHTQTGARYAVVQNLPDLQTNPVTMDIAISGGAAGAFNILDVFTTGAQFVQTLAGNYPAKLTGYWTAGGRDGTYFCNYYYYGVCDQGAGVYIFSNFDTDEYDDDVLWHEFGHFVANQFSRDDSPGGCHYLSSNDLDMRLTWSEGWGDFFPAAVKNWLAADAQRSALLSQTASTPLNTYIDTVGNAIGVYFDLDSLNTTQYIYASNELAVARVLLRVSQSLGMAAVWQVFTGYLPSVNYYVNIEEFWKGWLTLNNPGPIELASFNDIFSERYLDYHDDGFEPDDTAAIRAVTMGVPEVHYLYRLGTDDVDKVEVPMVAGKTYTITTGQLRNGADTYLRLRDGNGAVLAENDDYNSTYYRYDSMCGDMRYFNDGTSLASKIVYVAPATMSAYLEVSRTLDAYGYPSAGHYGTYTLTVQEQ